MDDSTRIALARIREAISSQTRITVLSGAGISAASGIPTFRGSADSLWENYRPEELATPEAFRADPELVWRWYDWRRGKIAAAAPNAAHEAVASLQDLARVQVVTQNVDGLHELAGSRRVLEFHGSIWKVRCLSCGAVTTDRRVPIPILPRCEVCRGLLRPGVVWFGEGIDPEVLEASTVAARDCDYLLVIGTAGAVYPAAGLVSVARDSGAHVVEFNLAPTALSARVDLFVSGNAADTLPHILP